MARSDDTIKFTIAAEETVVNDTVKIIATISGMVTPELTEKKLKDSIREMMEKFITAKWQFANITRNAHSSGYEEIKLVASARVPEAENRALDTRSRDVSQKGLSISNVTSDTSFPASLVEETEQKLRLEIIRKARLECNTISGAMDRTYRIRKIDYVMANDQSMYSNNASNRMSATMASLKTSYGAGFGGDAGGSDDTLGNAQKFTMNATITLASSPTTA